MHLYRVYIYSFWCDFAFLRGFYCVPSKYNPQEKRPVKASWPSRRGKPSCSVDGQPLSSTFLSRPFFPALRDKMRFSTRSTSLLLLRLVFLFLPPPSIPFFLQPTICQMNFRDGENAKKAAPDDEDAAYYFCADEEFHLPMLRGRICKTVAAAQNRFSKEERISKVIFPMRATRWRSTPGRCLTIRRNSVFPLQNPNGFLRLKGYTEFPFFTMKKA